MQPFLKALKERWLTVTMLSIIVLLIVANVAQTPSPYATFGQAMQSSNRWVRFYADPTRWRSNFPPEFTFVNTNTSAGVVNTNGTTVMIGTNAAAGGSSLTWQRWEEHKAGVDLLPFAISNNWGIASARQNDGTILAVGAGPSTYYSNATQLTECNVEFRANSLKTVYTDQTNTLACEFFVIGKTNAANASFYWTWYGNQYDASGRRTNSVLIYTNTTAYVTDQLSGVMAFTNVPMTSLFNTNLFPSYSVRILTTLLATNPANQQAIIFTSIGGGM